MKSESNNVRAFQVVLIAAKSIVYVNPTEPAHFFGTKACLSTLVSAVLRSNV